MARTWLLDMAASKPRSMPGTKKSRTTASAIPASPRAPATSLKLFGLHPLKLVVLGLPVMGKMALQAHT